jgi:hypothetical protein
MQAKTKPIKICPTLAELMAMPGVKIQITPWKK